MIRTRETARFVRRLGRLVLFCALAALCLRPARTCAVEPSGVPVARSRAVRDLLTADQWRRLDAGVDRGLEFIASRQQRDGSFETVALGQPGVTSLCVMAFLSRGHVPNEGRYGSQIDRAIDYVLQTQQADGLLFDRPLERTWATGNASHTAAYCHPAAGLMLSEVYGMTQADQRDRVREAIRKAIEFTRSEQLKPKRAPNDKGGWRYLRDSPGNRNQSDLSVTAWQLMFLRSARNAEFEVPAESITEAMAYVQRSFEPGVGSFGYGRQRQRGTTRAMAGSGILSLSLGGEHQSEMARTTGEWILRNPFDRYNQVQYDGERYHYSAYYCSQGMFQLGGDYWARFFPPFLEVLLRHQRGDGSWDPESSRDGMFGNTYTTALIVLALTPPYQILPIYQR